jgi:hypothetical protein
MRLFKHALRALHAEGIRVPERISVVGYDDLPESRFFEPPLTTVHHDFAGQGERCVEILLSMIKHQNLTRRFNFCVRISSFARVRRRRDDDGGTAAPLKPSIASCNAAESLRLRPRSIRGLRASAASPEVR